MGIYSYPISKVANGALSDEIALAIQHSRNFATAKPDIGQTERDHILGLCMLLERTLLQPSQAKRYADANPLGGPAKLFEAAASRIRAGENLDDVMDDYGLGWNSASKWKPIIEMLDSADRDWRRMLRPNLEGNEAMLFLVYDIAAERRMLCDEFCDSGGARIVR